MNKRVLVQRVRILVFHDVPLAVYRADAFLPGVRNPPLRQVSQVVVSNGVDWNGPLRDA